MGGTTPNYAIRFPYIDETITDVSTKNAADDIAAVLSTVLDVDSNTSQRRASTSFIRSTSQAVTANVETAIAGSSETFDTDASYDLAGQPTRITVPAGMGGVYWVSAYLNITGGTAWTSGQLAIAKNGTDFVRRKYWSASGQMVDKMLICGQVKLVPTDFLTMTVLFQGTPSPSNVQAVRLSAQRMTT